MLFFVIFVALGQAYEETFTTVFMHDCPGCRVGAASRRYGTGASKGYRQADRTSSRRIAAVGLVGRGRCRRKLHGEGSPGRGNAFCRFLPGVRYHRSRGRRAYGDGAGQALCPEDNLKLESVVVTAKEAPNAMAYVAYDRRQCHRPPANGQCVGHLGTAAGWQNG